VQIYRTTSHTKYDLKYHLVWITKYRRAVLSGAVGTRVRELVREIPTPRRPWHGPNFNKFNKLRTSPKRRWVPFRLKRLKTR
jgi:Transposase IS200 like